MKRTVWGIIVILLFTSLSAAINVQTVEASGTIYIRPDGSVDPPTAPIQRDGDIYIFTDNIYDEIVIEKDNIVLDGADYTLQGTGTGTGIDLSGRINITIKNTVVDSFYSGIYLYESSNNIISGNNVIDSDDGIVLGGYPGGSSNNIISRNTISNNIDGIVFHFSCNNNISGNTLTNNKWWGLWLSDSSNSNIFYHNNFMNNTGIQILDSSNNFFYHNNFINSTSQVYITPGKVNIWDNSYPSGGNYWSDHVDVDLCYGPYQDMEGKDGIWDNLYVIDVDNRDNFPLVRPYQPGDLSIGVYTDKYTYYAGDKMHLGLEIANPDSVKQVCLLMWLELPGGSTFVYLHKHSFILPVGTQYSNPDFKSLILPSILTGTYTWHTALLRPSDHKILVHDTSEWEFT